MKEERKLYSTDVQSLCSAKVLYRQDDDPFLNGYTLQLLRVSTVILQMLISCLRKCAHRQVQTVPNEMLLNVISIQLRRFSGL